MSSYDFWSNGCEYCMINALICPFEKVTSCSVCVRALPFEGSRVQGRLELMDVMLSSNVNSPLQG